MFSADGSAFSVLFAPAHLPARIPSQAKSMSWFTSLFRKKTVAPPEPFGRVEISDDCVRFHCRDRVDELAWRDLVEVGIVTTDEGPLLEDVYFILLGPGRKSGCAVPQGARGTEELLARLQTLPGFDHGAVIAAMGCTSNNRFTCWQKPDAPFKDLV